MGFSEVVAKMTDVKSSPEPGSTFDPDKRIDNIDDKEIKAKDTGNDVTDESFDPDKRLNEIRPDEEGFYTSRKERIDHTNKDISEGGSRGTWTGERGDSLFLPKMDYMVRYLEEYGLKGIEYKNGEADFSKVADSTVKIDHMTCERTRNSIDKNGNEIKANFTQANIKCAEQWNHQKRDGRDNWTARDVDEWKDKNKYSWHERCDMETMDLVPAKVHDYFKHSGGCAECRARDGLNGGVFDE